MRDKNSKIEILMKNLTNKQKIYNLVVTRGTKGSILYNKVKNKYFYCPL